MQLTRGVWQMSLAMIISGSIGAFVLLSGLPVMDVVFWRCLIGALTLPGVYRVKRPALQPANAFHSRSGSDWRRGAGRQLAAAVCRLFADLNPVWPPWSITPSRLCWY